MTGKLARGAIRSPNIWENPAIYEIENRAVDPDGLILAHLSKHAPWRDRVVLDIGAGTGFHLPIFATQAQSVIGVEPNLDLLAIAARRVRHLTNVELRHGSATALPVASNSVGMMQARWAYFFGPGCEPGLAELDRVMARGGVAAVIDNDPTRSTFGAWFRRGYPQIDPVSVERFWSVHGWERHPLLISWQFANRADFEAVVGIEFDRSTATWIREHHLGTCVDYAINIWIKQF
ncbi:MAG TPA: class I SAM-dependent methyltransferase [Marmoricola sp.]|nr:class I SAM-dependent methyltransferase [Marmoricola sp.]HNI70122.1 class I SAM-dependent methyltransferase [Marmoricola sp.]HNN48794.1 class I SAM-dependent methyltransferase [Marmoricola sp.]HNO40044.1 class I SAM-dependent methyltransferase [Marmoricola sp.]